MTSTWATLGILAAGMVVVIGGILVLRLHAFLALIFGALLVSALTPEAAIVENAVKNNAFVIVEADDYRSFHAGDGTPLVEEYASGPLRAGDDLVINVFVPVK